MNKRENRKNKRREETMRIIISPAKTMNIDTDTMPAQSTPIFLEKTKQILSYLQSLDYEELKKLWACNDKLAQLNYERVQTMDLERALTPALLSYEGIQYQYMAPAVFEKKQWEYMEEHLRILSGFYGILKPFDKITPYRLEMQAKAKVLGKKDLYEFWGDCIYKVLEKETNCIINLASKEYTKCIEKYLTPNMKYITIVFGEEKDGKVVQKGTMAKMARGEMVRYMAEEQIEQEEQLKNFDRLGYIFSEEYSSENLYTFLQ